MKRLFDISAALIGLIVLSPLLLVVLLLTWLQDLASPLYIAPRMARGGGTFRMVKIRSMVADASKCGVNSTAASDRRITSLGRFLRASKLDELPQLWNVLRGDMSLVGPRPQVPTDAMMYTPQERRMLGARPGVTDLASIVFADEGKILQGSKNPDLLYNQIIRPWKSLLSLLYVDHGSFGIDLWIIVLTIVGILSRPAALRGVERILRRWNGDELLIRMAGRQGPLLAYPPPGATEIVTEYPGTAA